MKKVTAFVGSARKQHTHYAVRQSLSFLNKKIIRTISLSLAHHDEPKIKKVKK